MKKFTLTRDFSGYSRGYEEVTIEAETKKQALALINTGEYPFPERETIRDDTTKGEWE